MELLSNSGISVEIHFIISANVSGLLEAPVIDGRRDVGVYNRIREIGLSSEEYRGNFTGLKNVEHTLQVGFAHAPNVLVRWFLRLSERRLMQSDWIVRLSDIRGIGQYHELESDHWPIVSCLVIDPFSAH